MEISPRNRNARKIRHKSDVDASTLSNLIQASEFKEQKTWVQSMIDGGRVEITANRNRIKAMPIRCGRDSIAQLLGLQCCDEAERQLKKQLNS
ncbi:hypothetical protein ACQ4M3_07725 [Leptolyngbya sp. AN03gr2]|uniref:hypothetical protein n=1 Tax=unclassified Leptolyngbya TaxID=2650499 RepID=UPI003D321FB2